MGSSYELNLTFSYEKNNCQCSLDKICLNNTEWQIFAVSRVIDLVDAEVGRLSKIGRGKE